MSAQKPIHFKWLVLVILLFAGQLSKAQLVANFSASPTSGCAPLLVNFTDSSTGNPTSWRWDLGNGTISFLRNPSVTYFNPGQYTIKLVISNQSGADSITKTQYINIYNSPNVEFSGTPTTGCFPLPVQFVDLSAPGNGTLSTWEWDFGDGNVANTQNPSHTYTGVGIFNITVRVKNSFGCSSILTKPQYIHIGSGVHADFSHSAATSCTPPVTITFQNQSLGTGVLSYQWSFGDGGTSTNPNPVYAYNNPGNYTVRLIVTNSVGCVDTIIKPNSVILGTVQAAFTSAATVCQGQSLVLTNTSNPVPGSVNWDFGDGSNATTINANKIYSNTGTYTIKMIAHFGACIDSSSRSVTVLPKPTSSFVGDIFRACKPPLTVNFISSVPGAVTYNWNFGDGSTSISPNPTHTYTNYGSFTVKLVVTNSSGCADSLIRTNYIIIQAPVVGIAGLPVRGCVPFIHNFTANVNSVDSVVGYQWDFGDGTTSILSSPTHTFANAGIYTIKLIITTLNGCTDTVIVPAGVTVHSRPHANFSANPLDVCAFFPITFTDMSTGLVDQWFWKFGDGGTSTQQNPVYSYQDTGYFSVTLVAYSNGCPDTIKFADYVHIKPPIADFRVGMNCGAPLDRVFTDHSIGADTWNWDFGDGTSSTNPSLTHTYATAGIYTVKLTVTNNASGCQHFKTLLVRVITEHANFMAQDTVICKGSTISFQTVNINPLNISSFSWDFGDGSSIISATQNTSHLYSQAGHYSVRLIITDLVGCSDTLVKPLYILVNGPTTQFTASTTGTCINIPINFSDSSYSDGTHPIHDWIWNYGDGTSDSLNAPPFQHTFSTSGLYTISLRIRDSNGCQDSLVRPLYITISRPVAAFYADTLSCTSGTIVFTDSSTGPGLTYIWNFGDGTTSNIRNPVHQYLTQGYFTVTLNILDQYGCTDNIIKTNYIHIANASAHFTMSDSITTCPPLIVLFTNTSNYYISRSWDFGDGTTSSLDNPTHFYTSAGTYHVNLSITGPGGCTDQLSKTVLVRGPQGSFTYTNIIGCKPLATNFVATTRDNLSFIWDFNDGTTTATFDSIRTHVYVSAGSFLPKLILIDTIGCHVPIIGSDTIKVFGVQSTFNLNTSVLCDSGMVSYTSTSTTNDPISSYFWTFGDGTTSSLQNPVHSFTNTGLYMSRLIVTTQFGCTDTSAFVTPVKVVASPQIAINGNNGACIPATINFNGQILVPDTSALSWQWNFANGNSSTLQNPPSQIYPNAGNYSVTALAINSSGCKDSIIKTVQAYPLPTVVANPDNALCRGQSFNLSASGAATYNWSPSNGLSCVNCATPVATPDTSIQYIVNGLSSQGCSGKDTVALSVKQPFIMNVANGDTLCAGKSVKLSASGASTYVWVPSTGLNNAAIAQPTATPRQTTTYMVVGTDDKGCFKDTGYVPVKVWPIPTVSAGLDKTINIGQTIDLFPTISGDVTAVNWTPTTGIFRNAFPGVTVKPNQTTEYTVDVSNPGGCKAKDKVTIFVICNNANIFIPNSFSPNGDGMNDQFYVRGSGLFTIKTLRIFNRWGQVVFEHSNVRPNESSDGWDGTFKGEKLTPDVFVYTVELICDNNELLRFQGNVALIK